MKVDYDYNVGVARNAKAQGCEQFHLLSGAGVTSKSRMEFLRNKVSVYKCWSHLFVSSCSTVSCPFQGKAEDESLALGFDRCFVYRPLTVFGDQRNNTARKFATAPFKCLTHVSSSVGIHIKTIPKVMMRKTVQVLPEDDDGKGILENSDMLKSVGARI